MPIFWLPDNELNFPDPSLADQDGILAIGGDLSPERLILAYRHGIFPWFNPGEPYLWWSPDPRFVLFPKELKIAKSMRPYFNQKRFEVTIDTDFRAVIRNCQTNNRSGQYGGTWITDEMLEAYCKLHELGYAHAVSVWDDGALVGGLYGVALGKVFFGESMFTKMSNASKFGFITLVKELEKRDFQLIDCQQQTRHLASLGAIAIPREVFLDLLEKYISEPILADKWTNWLA